MTEPRRKTVAGPLMVEEGIHGVFTRQQAPGAISNGARIRKINSEPGDGTPDGDEGEVLGSLAVKPDLLAELRKKDADYPDCDFSYFVMWDSLPRTAVGVLDFKVEEIA